MDEFKTDVFLKRKGSSKKDSGGQKKQYNSPQNEKKVKVVTSNSSECINKVRDILNQQQGPKFAVGADQIVIKHTGQESVEDIINLLFEEVTNKQEMEKLQHFVNSSSPSQTSVQKVAPSTENPIASTSAAAKSSVSSSSMSPDEIIYQALVGKLYEVEGYKEESWGSRVNSTAIPFFPEEDLTEEERMEVLRVLLDDGDAVTTETEPCSNQQRETLKNGGDVGVTGERIATIKREQLQPEPVIPVQKKSSTVSTIVCKPEPISDDESIIFIEERPRPPVPSTEKPVESPINKEELAQKLRERLEAFKRGRAKTSHKNLTVVLNNNQKVNKAANSNPAKDISTNNKLAANKNSDLNLVPQASKPSRSDETVGTSNPPPSQKKKMKQKKYTNDELIDMMKTEVQKEEPSLTLLSGWMKKTFEARKEELENTAIDIPTLLDKYPALKICKILKEEFGRVSEDENKMINLERKLQNEFRADRKLSSKKSGFKDPWLDSAQQTLKDELEKILGMICLSFRLAEDGVRRDLCRIIPKEWKYPPPDRVTPAMHVQETQIFELDTKIKIYVDGGMYLSVPNVYEGVLCLYAIFWLHNLEYSKGVKNLFEFFDALIGNGQSTYKVDLTKLL
ncbi:hypothetical protein Ocin01_18875 [Orchesella cincta]|uniref:Uncharacterized protein n=1 Tax=Orchesella cincta TaxID=48709 RepID=A0A1D2M4B3_ORCCI|nr:hypothetical protein Ocin01_18875 [Orchesella cincta]